MRNIIACILMLVATVCHSQTDSTYTITHKRLQKVWSEINFSDIVKDYTATYQYRITDEETNYTFEIDSSETYVTATNKKGNVIWKTNPWLDNELPLYRHNNPAIVNFGIKKFDDYLLKHGWIKQNSVIWISYSNSQMGYLNKLTGEFMFYGQD